MTVIPKRFPVSELSKPSAIMKNIADIYRDVREGDKYIYKMYGDKVIMYDLFDIAGVELPYVSVSMFRLFMDKDRRGSLGTNKPIKHQYQFKIVVGSFDERNDPNTIIDVAYSCYCGLLENRHKIIQGVVVGPAPELSPCEFGVERKRRKDTIEFVNVASFIIEITETKSISR